jgi:tetratricopeptide (TPR) repeat protein
MNWKDYEKEVHVYFSQMYSNLKITYDAKSIGRYSKKERQIDVLIEGEIAGFPLKIVVDAKYFSKNIDVKCVESFISMLEDINADQGLLVTQKGYSEAAINRAYYGPQKLELDVLNFDEILQFQGLTAIPCTGRHSLCLPAPFGWVVDINKQDGCIACLYQRGLTLEVAKKKNEWIYFNFWKKDSNASTIKELNDLQIERMKVNYKNLDFDNKFVANRSDDLETYIRVAQYDDNSFKEITGYIDCGEFISFFVLFTPEELQDKNIRKLNHILKYSQPLQLEFDNHKLIEGLENKLINSRNEAKASIYNQLAKLYSEMNDSNNEINCRRLCWNFDSGFYINISPLITCELMVSNFQEAISYSKHFFAMEPDNPRIMQDLITVFDNPTYLSYFEILINELITLYKSDKEASANIYFHYAIHLFNSKRVAEAAELFSLTKRLFKSFNKNHYAIELIDNMLREKA